MDNDPFYGKIFERLNGHLDDQVFQSCVGDLLRKNHPGIVPYTGGDDAGMDGAIPDFENVPYPLIVTTSEDAIGNLTRNLEKYISEQGKQRKAVFATSRRLTPARIQNLFKRSEELGFKLIQAYHQEWFANALYRDPAWCLRLLGLSGKPSALSKIPLISRPFSDLRTVGRDEDTNWLFTTNGDRLLVGQPGSGKTFLLNKFVQSNGGLFVVSDNLQDIADDIRSMQPVNLIVDDAHTKIDLIKNLIHLRQELQVNFGIIASSWNGDEQEVVKNLQIDQNLIHYLSLLTREQIVEVIYEAGLIGPDQLIKEIVDQSNGQPGLSITLVQVCFESGAKEIFLGEAINNSIINYFSPVLGKESIAILASFAMGGDAGIEKKTISHLLGISLIDLWKLCSQFAAGGVIWDAGRECLSVYPKALRFALIKEVFFSKIGFSSEVFVELYEQSPSKHDSLSVIIGSKRCGAAINNTFIQEQLLVLDDNSLWDQYTSIGKQETEWVLDNYPEKVNEIAFVGLYYIPDKTLPLLFKSAIGDNRLLNSTPNHPLRVIQDWIESSEPGTNAAISNRVILLNNIITWIDGEGDLDIAMKALGIVFSPKYETNSSNPGNGMRITFRSGCLTLIEIDSLFLQWERVISLFQKQTIKDWNPILNFLPDWLYPSRLNFNVNNETRRKMRELGSKILKDLSVLVQDQPVYQRRIKQLGKENGIRINVPLDKEFEVIYPLENWKDYKKDKELQKKNSETLALNWSNQDPRSIITKIVAYEQDALYSGLRYPRWTPFICQVISRKTQVPIQWCKAAINADMEGELIIPFLEIIADGNYSEWITLAHKCLQNPRSAGSTIIYILTSKNSPDELILEAIQKLEKLPQRIDIIQHGLNRGEVPIKIMSSLLTDSDNDVSSSAAYHEWYCEPEQNIRPELFEVWNSTVINNTNPDYWLTEVFSKEPGIAYKWLEAHIDTLDLSDYSNDIQTISTAINVINIDQKKYLLQKIKPEDRYKNFLRRLIGDNLDLYQLLLTNRDLQMFHLEPLYGNPENDTWINKAKEALNYGFSPANLALASIYGSSRYGVGWSGHESNMWQGWIDHFTSLQNNVDSRVKKIGDEGKHFAEEQKIKALKKERDEEIFGFEDKRRWLRG